MPSAVLSDLRAAFGEEVTAVLADGDLVAAAHVLASSAWVVGEPEIARLARAVEQGAPADALREALEGYAS